MAVPCRQSALPLVRRLPALWRKKHWEGGGGQECGSTTCRRHLRRLPGFAEQPPSPPLPTLPLGPRLRTLALLVGGHGQRSAVSPGHSVDTGWVFLKDNLCGLSIADTSPPSPHCPRFSISLSLWLLGGSQLICILIISTEGR